MASMSSSVPPCPRCRTAKQSTRHDGDMYYCSRCGGLYDNDPDEGGDYSARNPGIRIEREERAREQQRARRRF